MTQQKQPKNWRRMLADLGGYENGLINIPAAGVIPIIDEVEALRAKLNELEKQERIHDQIAAEVAMAADKRRPT